MHPVHGGGGGEPCVPERPCGLLKAHSWWEAEQDPNPRHPAASPARTMTVFSQHMSWVRGVTHLVLREGLGHAGSWKTSWDGATRLHSGPRPRPASIPATLYQALPTWTRLGAAARSQSSWAESCASWASPTSLCLSFLICKLGRGGNYLTGWLWGKI